MKKYSINDIVNVQISSIQPYGVFVTVDDFYTGLIHISEINGKYIKNINNLFNVGDMKKVRIIGIDEEKKHLNLSMIGVRNVNELNYKVKYNKKLRETNLGFDLFEEILPEWINEKLKEIEDKSK